MASTQPWDDVPPTPWEPAPEVLSIPVNQPLTPTTNALLTELLAVAHRQAAAAEATYTLVADLVNGLTSNPMVAAMMGAT